ncbi:glycosyltransferase family 4 protein [Verrucomicrobium sp. BvORR106]|uniref:glycosyltransferase family 4 protein n=1 Tax=Verrucomicrobium sp. BvORR106 TaxID=1403819 RepID=UPI002240FB67|nr:glycosyltransferase family 4 protein [Verrucomicrobium sp. BvORR106]
MEALVFDADPRLPHLAARSARSLRAAGFEKITIRHAGSSPPGLTTPGAVLLLRAGAWLRHPAHFQTPPFHPASHPVMAVGHVAGTGPAEPWSRFFETHGGDFSTAETLPPCVCEWFDESAVAIGLAEARLTASPLPVAAALKPPRIFHWSPLDAGFAPGLRCLQIVTSLQHGGAERIAWDLAQELPRTGVATRLISLGKPLRRTLPELPGTLDLSQYDRSTRAERLRIAAHHFGADVLHGHLIDQEDMQLFSASGIPLATTIHNTQAAWPQGLESLRAEDAGLLIACAQTVESELAELKLPVPLRTVWNGISMTEYAGNQTPDPARDEFVLACVANPRPQKRLHLLPAILSATQQAFDRCGMKRQVRLILAGEASPRSPSALECYEQIRQEAARHGVTSAITWTHGAIDTKSVLAQADAAISCSAYEGLSLAHMEALAMGLPLISTDAGGTRELAPGNPALTLLPLEASPTDFAEAIVALIQTPPASGVEAVARDFSTPHMARRVGWLLQSLATQAASPAGEGILFVTNNLSTGGAQSSLRRLALSLQAQGIPVTLALLQEYPEHPTPGRTALEQAGIPFIVPPPAGTVDPAIAVRQILDHMAPTPSATIVFWNAIPVHKILLADAVWSARIFDVSPGEMYFASLDRYFLNPRPALPVRTARDYGQRLSGVIVKYHDEAERAKELLGAPTYVVPNGVLLPEPLPLRPPAPAPFVFGTAARLSPQKRLGDLLEAFRIALPELPKCELHIAGGPEHDGAEHVAELHRLAEGLPVIWCGELTDLRPFHASLDAFVMISEPAGCPNASLEALAAGLPVVATDFGGAREQVIHEQTGLLVPPRDATALAAAMVRMAADSDLRARCAAGARAHIEAGFTLERMLFAYRRVLLED